MTAGHRSLLTLFNTGRCTRRTFLLSALLSLTAGGFGSKRYSLANNGPELCVEPPWLRKTIADRQTAARLGRAYLDAHPEYRHCHALLTDIERTLKRQHASVSLTADTEQTASALHGLLRKEYAHGEVVSVAGWVLSKTEAQLYALVYLVTTIDLYSEPGSG
jgi:hypothetical protein